MFSGIGGFEYGMEQSNYEFECVGYSEIDKYARSIYEKHYPNHINYGDATQINTEDLPSFELLVGGFPCQAFSIAGYRRGFADCRGTLFFEIARVLRDKKPKYFLLENVKGLLSHNKGNTFKTIIEVCDELGYDVSWKVYNSKNYGVPQNRERVFLKGYFREKCGGEVLYFREKSKETEERLKKQDNYMIGTPVKVYGSMQEHRAETDGTYAPCLTAMASSNTNRPMVEFEDYHIRTLTPKECERLQGFSDDWTKYGKEGELINDAQRYKCCGNAVTVNVIKAIFDDWELKI